MSLESQKERGKKAEGSEKYIYQEIVTETSQAGEGYKLTVLKAQCYEKKDKSKEIHTHTHCNKIAENKRQQFESNQRKMMHYS